MTPQEFKAWFTGYSEHVSDHPTAKQWKRICDRVTEIDGVATTHPVFVERYWPRPWYQYPYFTNAVSSTSLSVGDTMVMGVNGMPTSATAQSFNVANAFATLGQTDAQMDA